MQRIVVCLVWLFINSPAKKKHLSDNKIIIDCQLAFLLNIQQWRFSISPTKPAVFRSQSPDGMIYVRSLLRISGGDMLIIGKMCSSANPKRRICLLVN